MENRIVRGDERSMEEDGEEDISRRKIKGTIKRLKDGKAAGIDGIPSGACRWGDAPPTLDGAPRYKYGFGKPEVPELEKEKP